MSLRLLKRLAADVAIPPAGKVAIFADLADGVPKIKESDGSVFPFPQFSGRPLASLAAPVVTVGTTELIVLRAPIAANAVMAGSTFRVKVAGVTAASGNPTFRVRAGALGTIADTQLAIIGPITSAAAAGGTVELYVAVRSIGVAGSIAAHGLAAVGATNSQPTAVAAQVLNTTTPWFLELTAAMSASTFTAHVGAISTA